LRESPLSSPRQFPLAVAATLMTTPTVSATLLDDWARRLSGACDVAVATRSNETELREDIDSVIRRAASELYGLTDREITAERRAGAGGTKRRYDKAYGGLVVEWEWDMGSSRRRHGAEQALGYLTSMRDALGLEEAFTAVVTDGRQWGFLASDLSDRQLSLLEPDILPDGRFQWRQNSPAACRRFLASIHRCGLDVVVATADRASARPWVGWGQLRSS
jgi:hypothetical protein